MATRKLKNSKLNPNTGNSNETTGNASARGNIVSEAFAGAAGGRTAEERAAWRRKLEGGEEKVS